MTKDKVSVIIPAFNEAKNIGSVIKDLKKLDKLYNLQLIVVDDASRDDTSLVAREFGADIVITHKKNKGKGAGFRTGLKYALGNFIVQFDADGQLRASDIPLIVEKLKEGADIVLGARYNIFSFLESGSARQSNVLGNLFVSLIATIFSGKFIIDVMTGLKGFQKKAISNIKTRSNDFAYEAELVILASKKNLKISTVKIICRERNSGRSNLEPFKHGFSVIKTIIYTAFFR